MCAKGNILRNFLAGKEIAGEALSADIVIPKNEAYSRMGARALSAGRGANGSGANGVGGSANGEDDQILSELMVGVISLFLLSCALCLFPSLSLCSCADVQC